MNKLKAGARVKFLAENREHEGTILGFLDQMRYSIWAYDESTYSSPQVYYVDQRDITGIAFKHKFVSPVDIVTM